MQLLQAELRTIALCYALLLFINHSVIPQSESTYKTFAFKKFDATVLSPYQMIHVSQENAEFVRSFIQKELESHGLQLSPSPDLFVNLEIVLKLEQQVIDEYHLSTKYKKVSNYEVGTLIVRLTDSTSNKLLWEGSRTIPLWKKKEKAIRRKVDNIVAKVFKGFEPNALSITQN